MYYAFDPQIGKSTVLCIHPRYFVASSHGTHLQLQIGSTIRIFPAKSETNEGVGNEGHEVAVLNIEERLGFIVLRSEKAIGPKSPRLVPAEKSESFLLAGFGDMDTGTQQLVYSTGIVHSVDHYFCRSDKSMGPLVLGTVPVSRRNSGGACWSAKGLIGIICGVTTVRKRTHSVSDAISKEGISSPTNYISPATHIRQSIVHELGKEKAASIKASVEKEGKVFVGGPAYAFIVDLDEP